MLIRLGLMVYLSLVAMVAVAQNPRALIDTDRGPLLVELDAARAPITTANFLAYTDAGTYNRTLFQRVVNNFVVQGGGFLENGVAIARRPAIASERTNGLLNSPGTLAMALSGNPPNVSSATSEFFINTGNNTALNGNFTVFGRVIFGQKTLAEINSTTLFAASEQPIRIPLVKRIVRVAPGAFPILPLHTGAWYDPANGGKGFFVEVTQPSGREDGPIVYVSWYDYFEGKQIWVSGLAPITWGADSVDVPLLITTGGQFGGAFNPSQVQVNGEWGRITIRFTGCDAGTFTYTSLYGNGSVPVRSLTLPTNESCVGN